MLNSYSNCVRETIAYFNERTAKKLIDTTALYFMMDFFFFLIMLHRFSLSECGDDSSYLGV